jgi:hypothetical protein
VPHPMPRDRTVDRMIRALPRRLLDSFSTPAGTILALRGWPLGTV